MVVVAAVMLFVTVGSALTLDRHGRLIMDRRQSVGSQRTMWRAHRE